MKKMMIMLLALVLMIAMAATAFAATTYYIKTESGNYVNVRAGRGTNYDKIGTLNHGQSIELENIKDGWAKFNYGSYGYGYVSANFVSKTKPAAVTKKTSTNTANISASSAGEFDMVKSFKNFETVQYKAIVQPATTTSNINLRWAPSKSAPIMGLRRAGYELRVIADNGTWCQVYDEATNEVGFMMKTFLLEVVDGGPNG